MKFKTASVLAVLMCLSHFITYGDYYMDTNAWGLFAGVSTVAFSITYEVCAKMNKLINSATSIQAKVMCEDMHKYVCERNATSSNVRAVRSYYAEQSMNLAAMRHVNVYKYKYQYL